MLFALPYAIAFHVPFVLVENALPVGDAAARASIAGFLAALAAAPVGVPAGCSLSKRRVQLGAGRVDERCEDSAQTRAVKF